jgi:hypothetical protein
MGLNEIGWNHPAADRGKLWAVVVTIMNLWVRFSATDFLTSCGTGNASRNYCMDLVRTCPTKDMMATVRTLLLTGDNYLTLSETKQSRHCTTV